MNFNNWLYYRFDGFLFLHTDAIFTKKQMYQQQQKKRRDMANLCVRIEPFSSD